MTHCGAAWLSVRGLRQSVMRARNSLGGAARKPLRLRLSRKPSTSTAALVPLKNHFLTAGWRGLPLPLLLAPSPPPLPLLELPDDPTHSSRAAKKGRGVMQGSICQYWGVSLRTPASSHSISCIWDRSALHPVDAMDLMRRQGTLGKALDLSVCHNPV